jgi:hypothetical protein
LPTKELLHRTANTEEDAVCRIRSEERERKREDNTKFEKRKREEKEQAGMERMRSSSLESFSPDETFTNTSNETIRSVTRKFTPKTRGGKGRGRPPKDHTGFVCVNSTEDCNDIPKGNEGECTKCYMKRYLEVYKRNKKRRMGNVNFFILFF